MSSARNGMTRPTASSPAAARRQLGADLRAMRKSAAMTLDDVATEIQRSTATMSRLERGNSTPRLVDVRELLEIYGERVSGLVTDATRESMLGLVRQSRQDDWFNDYRDVLGNNLSSAELQRYVELESDAREIHSFEASVVPGLFQTASYAAAVADLFQGGESDAQKARFVEFRMARKRVLEHLDLHVVISESALRRQLGSPVVMIEQLGVLAAELRDGRPKVTVQIAPADLVVRAAVNSAPFVLMHFDTADSDVVFLEGAARPEYVRGAGEIARFADEFAELSTNSLNREQSLKLVEEVTESYR